jgi:N-acetylglutamate synthase
MSAVTIRPFVDADYVAAVALWSATEGVTLNESDTPEAIASFLVRNPDLSAVAIDADGKLIGAVLCGHNGRNGSILHLAVVPERRHQGIGRHLVNHCLTKLAEVGIARCNIHVTNDNGRGNQFWFDSGWVDPPTWKVLQKQVARA